MIRDLLIPALRERYPQVQTGEPPHAIAVFEAPHSGIGTLAIRDDEDEATVVLGQLTHFHIFPHDPDLSQMEADQAVTDETLDFLEALFADEVVVWEAADRRQSGITYIDPAKPPELPPGAASFVWSGPYQPSSS